MGKPVTDSNVIRRIITMRETGHTLTEIVEHTRCSKSTVYRYIKEITIDPLYAQKLKNKQNKSANRSQKLWQEENENAANFLQNITDHERVILLIGLYWGEGTKRELNVINGDPDLIRNVIQGLLVLGVSQIDIKYTIRVYGLKTKEKCAKYWAASLGIKRNDITGYEILPQRSQRGRLMYGMCRIRVKRSQRFFKFIMSMINLLRAQH